MTFKRTPSILLRLFSLATVVASFSVFTQAQRFDVAAGFSGIDAPGAAQGNGIQHQPLSLTGGGYLTFSGDFLFFRKHIGIEGEYVRRLNKGYDYYLYDLPYRPMFGDANAIWTRKFKKRFAAELVGGFGVASTNFYTGSCSGSKCYASSNRFMADMGGGLKIYPLDTFLFRHVFIRPEGRYYLIKNNQFFSSNTATRYGASIGYTF